MILRNSSCLDFILAETESILTISDIQYSASKSILFRARKSSVQIENLQFETISGASNMGELVDCYNSTISEVSSSDTQITEEYLFVIKNSKDIILRGIDISNCRSKVMLISSSYIIKIDRMKIKNCIEGLTVESSIIGAIENSTFEQNGETEHLYGGAMKIVDSSVDIINSNFTANKAYIGGVIYFT